MILKQQPDDFHVEEIPRPDFVSDGPFAFYRMEKSGWTTPDALAVLRKRWALSPRRVSFGGLKDRHARTVQYLTVFHGPRRSLNQQGIHVEYLGQAAAAYTSHDFERNRFRLILRDIAPATRLFAEEALARLPVQGVPNYFDDQRFGSVEGAGGEFIARLLVRGRFEHALRLALTSPYEFDRAAQKEEKRLLAAHWGDWPMLAERLSRGDALHLIEYLRFHPTDFRGALVRLRPELRTLYLSAYQSHLWNRLLAEWLRRHVPAESLHAVTLRLGAVPFHVGLTPDQLREFVDLSLPLPSARLKLADDDPQAGLVRDVLAEEGLNLRDLQVRGIREMFFSKGNRRAQCVPQELAHAFDDDELHAGRLKLALTFDLPRGSYATLVVKQVFG